MIYVDTSILLAQLFAEDRVAPLSMWDNLLVSSRLLEYELWNRIHARGFSHSHGDDARALLRRIAFIELTPPVLARALEPFPVPVRTLDSLHLASLEFIRAQRQPLSFATFDQRLGTTAMRLGIPLAAL